MSIQFEFKKYSFQEVASYFKEKKLKNLILFSQARSGSTFATENFSKFLNFKNYHVFLQNILNKKSVYLKNLLH